MRKCLQNIFAGGADRKRGKRGQFFNRSRGVCCSRRAVWIRKIDTEVFAIISAADPSIGQIPQRHLSLVDLIRFKPEEAPRRALYELALKGVRFGNAVSEIGGKNVKDLKTRITPVDGGFTVTGRKFYATGALFAHIVPVA